ncbi:MAG: SCP2 sterol-binding domain-containing protein [Pseudochelatococcus sp.]|jgi:putative sterol carrier protein|uniref:SCP2 sterol-binding domain-containing protein n=1 Tax=Pseudochelatococcus sp. TaxID=2020869 RepID=UPI003D8E006B
MVATEELIDAIRARIGGVDRIGYRIVVALSDSGETITIDDGADGVGVTAGGGEDGADTVVRLSSDNLQKLIAGRLNPLIAYSTGRLKVEGSQGVALKIAALLQGDD